MFLRLIFCLLSPMSSHPPVSVWMRILGLGLILPSARAVCSGLLTRSPVIRCAIEESPVIFPKFFNNSEPTLFDLLKYASDLGFSQLTLRKLNPVRHLLGLSRTSIPEHSRGSVIPEKAFSLITSSLLLSGCSR